MSKALIRPTVLLQYLARSQYRQCLCTLYRIPLLLHVCCLDSITQ
jgi:hypothetical protein